MACTRDRLCSGSPIKSSPRSFADRLPVPSRRWEMVEPMGEDSTQQLIEQVRAGNAEALGHYIQHMRQQLLAFIDRQLGSALRRKVEPEDILQEVSADAVRSLSEVNLAQWDPFSWLCQIVQRRIVDAHRHYIGAQKRSAAREVPLAAGGSSRADLINLLVQSLTTPSRAFSRNAKEARLMEALQQLPEQQQRALKLRYMDGLPSKEIAQQLGKSDAAVRVMLTRSLSKLQQLLADVVR